MKVDLRNKVAVVTGASRGIGAEIAYLLAKNGATVVLHYKSNRKAAEQTFSRLQGHGHLLIQENLSKMKGINSLVTKVINTFENIDILVNNAGIYNMKTFDFSDFKSWQSHWRINFDLNLFAPVHLSYLFAKEMVIRGGGRIINISSRGAFRGEPDAPAYGAAKAALNSFSQSMAKAMAEKKVFVYTIAPGFVDTKMVESAIKGPDRDDYINQSPLKRVATAREIADVALFCASQAPEYMTASIIDVNGASYLRT